MKKGSLDNYLLESNIKHIDSRMGLHLRQLMKQKLKNPEMEVPYVAGQANCGKGSTRKTHRWMARDYPTVYMPANVRAVTDSTQFYAKTPQQMSRYEIADLEKELRAITSPEQFAADQEKDAERLKLESENDDLLDPLA